MSVGIFVNNHDYEKLTDQSNNRIKENKITILETVNGAKIAARHNIYDIRIIKEQFIDLQYFPNNVYENNFKPRVVLDIGGYIGDLSLYCASTFNSKVHCYEPTPQNFNIIETNLELNPELKNNITIFNKGISGKTESIRLNVQDMTGEIHASSHKIFDRHNNEITIPCVSLFEAINTLNEPIIDLLKIDCEGQEFEILGDINLNELSKKIKYLVFEHHKFVNNYETRIKDLLEKLKVDFDIIHKRKNLYFLKSKKED